MRDYLPPTIWQCLTVTEMEALTTPEWIEATL